jgi:hypothetical protein
MEHYIIFKDGTQTCYVEESLSRGGGKLRPYFSLPVDNLTALGQVKDKG